jgi:hypothetical protein
VRIKRHRRKKHDTGLAQLVCGLHSNFKRRIIERSLCSLHPVNNARAVIVRIAGPPDSNPRIRAQAIKVLHL